MSKQKILLVDDVNLMLELEKSFLKNSPVEVLTAANGEQALEIARKESPDLIFMDLNMPKMDGPTCCQALKSDPELRHIPVVMVTTAGSAEDEERCRHAGCDDFITKPIDRRLFLEKGRKYLEEINRREPRFPCQTSVVIEEDREEVAALSSDISIGGLYVGADARLDNEKMISFSFALPGGRSGLIEAKGRVAWRNSPDERKNDQLPVGFGVEFTEIRAEDLEAIMDFLSSLKAES